MNKTQNIHTDIQPQQGSILGITLSQVQGVQPNNNKNLGTIHATEVTLYGNVPGTRIYAERAGHFQNEKSTPYFDITPNGIALRHDNGAYGTVTKLLVENGITYVEYIRKDGVKVSNFN